MRFESASAKSDKWERGAAKEWNWRNDKQLLRNKQNGIHTCEARIEQRRTQGIKEVLMKIMIRLSSQSCVIVNIVYFACTLIACWILFIHLFLCQPPFFFSPEVESVFVYSILSESIHAHIDYFYKLQE